MMMTLANTAGYSAPVSRAFQALLVALVVFVTLLTSCALADPRNIDIDHLIALDKEASFRVSLLSRLRGSTWHLSSAEPVSNTDVQAAYRSAATRLTDEAEQLLSLEYQINRALEDAYIPASKELTVDNRILLVQLAALHWHSQLRRHLQRGLHTSVPGLESDPRCAGDLLADEMLLDYLRAVWGDPTSSIQRVADSLGRIATQSACLGAEQSDHFARASNDAFADVEAFLRVHRLEWVIPSLATLLAQPLLLFYDVEKYRGVDSPLGRWFTRYQDVLVEAVHHRRLPPQWHGLWLYDRTTGRLVGLAERVIPKDENEVRLDRFFTSVTSPENLGAGDCSFSEMVQRGLGDAGYVCGGATCELDRELESAAFDVLNGSSASRESALSKLQILKAAGGLGRLPADAVSHICLSGREQSQGGGGSLCSGAATGNALSPLAATLSCVSRQVVRPGTEVMSCVMEASGYCSDPVGRLSKDLRSNDLNGIPVGKECGIGGDEANGSQNNAARPLSPATRKELQDAQTEQRDAQLNANKKSDALNAAEATAEKAKKELGEAEAAAKAAYTEYQKAVQSMTPDPDAIKKAREKEAAADQNLRDKRIDLDRAEREVTKAAAAKRDADIDLRKANERLDKANNAAWEEWDDDVLPKEVGPPQLPPEIQAILLQGTGSLRGEAEQEVLLSQIRRGRCDPDNPECDANRCTAMSESARKTMACVKKMSQDTQPPEFMARGLGCDPNNCDPEETTATSAPRGSKCLALMDPGASQGLVMKQCGLVYCAGGESAFVTSQGTCGCGLAPALGAGVNQTLASQCSNLTYCESGTAEYKNGSCVCKDATTPNVVRGPENPNLMVISSPPAYLNKNPIPPSPQEGVIQGPQP